MLIGQEEDEVVVTGGSACSMRCQQTAPILFAGQEEALNQDDRELS